MSLGVNVIVQTSMWSPLIVYTITLATAFIFFLFTQPVLFWTTECNWGGILFYWGFMEHAHRYSLRETREQNVKNDQLRKINQKPVIKRPDFLGVAKSCFFRRGRNTYVALYRIWRCCTDSAIECLSKCLFKHVNLVYPDKPTTSIAKPFSCFVSRAEQSLPPVPFLHKRLLPVVIHNGIGVRKASNKVRLEYSRSALYVFR